MKQIEPDLVQEKIQHPGKGAGTAPEPEKNARRVSNLEEQAPEKEKEEEAQGPEPNRDEAAREEIKKFQEFLYDQQQ